MGDRWWYAKVMTKPVAHYTTSSATDSVSGTQQPAAASYAASPGGSDKTATRMWVLCGLLTGLSFSATMWLYQLLHTLWGHAAFGWLVWFMPVGLALGVGSLYCLYDRRAAAADTPLPSPDRAFMGGATAGLIPGIASLMISFPIPGLIILVLFIGAVVMIP